MAEKTTRTVRLVRTYLFDGKRYGPGTAVEVPADFPEIDDRGDIIHEEGSDAAKNQARARTFSSSPNTGGVNTGEDTKAANTVSGKSAEVLETMSKADLETLAEELGIEVAREDGESGDPLKSDYVTALSEKRG